MYIPERCYCDRCGEDIDRLVTTKPYEKIYCDRCQALHDVAEVFGSPKEK